MDVFGQKDHCGLTTVDAEGGVAVVGIPIRLLLKDPQGGGGGLASPGRPTHPTHIMSSGEK